MTLANSPDSSKNSLLIRITCFCWIIAKLVCRKLWLADRLFPIVPPFHLFVPSFVHLGLYVFSLVALLVLFIYPSAKRWQVCLVVFELLSCMLDQNRWQPWEYQYIFTMLIFLINWKREKNSSDILLWMIAAIYFYSGLSKLNPAFANYIGDRVIHKLPFAFHIGYLLGLMEACLGVGLLIKRIRKTAAVFLIIMHTGILTVLISTGINSSIWPWNIAMIAYLLVLVLCSSLAFSFRSVLVGWNKLILVLFGIMPALNFIGYWDYYLSSNLYSCKPPYMYICVPKKSILSDKLEVQPGNTTLCDTGSVVINVTKWAYQEMNSPVYPELRVYNDIREQLLKDYPAMDDRFFIYTYHYGVKPLNDVK